MVSLVRKSLLSPEFAACWSVAFFCFGGPCDIIGASGSRCKALVLMCSQLSIVNVVWFALTRKVLVFSVGWALVHGLELFALGQ